MSEGRSFYERVVNSIKSIPEGKVATYGMIARLAGNSRAARQVAYILSSSSRRHSLPWHRVVNRKGGISLKPARGYEEQKDRLESEGLFLREDGTLDLSVHLWKPRIDPDECDSLC